MSPIIYLTFIAPLLYILPIVPALFETNNFSTLLISIILVGAPLFWLANMGMARIEKLLKPKVLDHFRQSGVFYFIALYVLVHYLRYGYYGTLNDAYFLPILTISIVAIITNGLFLYKRYRANIS